jgi:hypothetical protein
MRRKAETCRLRQTPHVEGCKLIHRCSHQGNTLMFFPFASSGIGAEKLDIFGYADGVDELLFQRVGFLVPALRMEDRGHFVCRWRQKETKRTEEDQ